MGSKFVFVEREYRHEVCVTYSALKTFNQGSLRSTSTSRWMYSRPDLPTTVEAILMPVRGIGDMERTRRLRSMIVDSGNRNL